MSHKELTYWDFERNGYEITMVTQLPPRQGFPYERFCDKFLTKYQHAVINYMIKKRIEVSVCLRLLISC